MAASSAPSNGSAGKVIGTRRIVPGMPWSPSVFQNGWLRRPPVMRGLPRGSRNGPSRSVRGAGATRAEQSSGRSDRRFGVRKSKMRCLPGLQPVWNDAQATGDSAGSVVRSRRKAPSARSRAKCGRTPSSISRSVSSGSCPSRPSTITRPTRPAVRTRPPRSHWTARRRGQVASVTSPRTIVQIRTNSDETNAKPAPGPT